MPLKRGEFMVYGYVRVSTKGQARDGNSIEAQEKILREHGAEKIFVDSFTGSKMDRPQFDILLNEIKEGDTLVVAKLDRFARSVAQASELITKLIGKNIRVDVANLGVLDNSSISTLMRNVLLCFAQFERDMIVERTQEGKAIARQKPDYREGRPKKYNRKQIAHALELLKTMSYKQVEEITGISKSTLIRAKRSKY
jgi:DNA invertase Pin-like site-specific DNA recombinase